MVDISFWMVDDPATVERGETVFNAIMQMYEKESDSVIITTDKKPVGIFTEKDLLRKIVAQEKDAKTTKIDEVMTTPVETIDMSKEYREVLRLMKDKKYRHVPVVDETGVLIGLVTMQSMLPHI